MDHQGCVSAGSGGVLMKSLLLAGARGSSMYAEAQIRLSQNLCPAPYPEGSRQQTYCIREPNHVGPHYNSLYEWNDPQVFICDSCEEHTNGIVTEAEARALGFWQLCGKWFCSSCHTFPVAED